MCVGVDETELDVLLQSGYRVLSRSGDFSLRALETHAASSGALLTMGVDSCTVREEALVDDLLAEFPHIRTLLRTSLRRNAIERLVSACSRSIRCRISIRGLDNFGSDLRGMISGNDDRGATRLILEEIAREIPAIARDVVVGAAAIGWQRTSVADLATACHIAERTVDWRLAHAGLISGSALLGQILCVHSVWRMEVLGWSPKQTAGRSGFGNVAAFTNFLKRHTGMTPGAAIAEGGGRWLLAQLLASLQRNIGIPRTPRRTAGGGWKDFAS